MTIEDTADATSDSVDLVDGIAFQLRYLATMRIFRYKTYTFAVGLPIAVFYVVLNAVMFVLHLLTIVHCGSLKQFTGMMYVFSIQINELFKLYDIVSQRHRIAALLDGQNERAMFASTATATNNVTGDGDGYGDIVGCWSHSRRLRAARRHVRVSSLLLYVCIASSALMLLVTAALGFGERALLFECWFPWSLEPLAGYALAGGIQIGYTFYLSSMNITLDTLLTGLMHFVAVQLDVVRLEMERLGAPTGDAKTATCVDVVAAVRRVVVVHQRTIGMLAEIVAIFNRGIFVQCLTCGVTLCIVGYRILIAEMFSNDFFAMILLLSGFLGEIFYYCHYGNEIKLKSESLSEALYSCRWYDFRCTCNDRCLRSHQRVLKTSISIIMERLKRPAIVQAGYLLDLTYDTFIAICRSGFRAFAVLRDMQLK